MPDFLSVCLENVTSSSTHKRIFEVKSITFCSTWYASDDRLSAVQKRANVIPADYVRKARKLDHKFCNTPLGVDGPVYKSLLSYGNVGTLVFGRFSEKSVGVTNFIKCCATLKARRLVSNFNGSVNDMSAMRASFSQTYTRKLAMTSLVAKATLLLDRKMYIGLPYAMHRSHSADNQRPFHGLGRDDFSSRNGRGSHFNQDHYDRDSD